MIHTSDLADTVVARKGAEELYRIRSAEMLAKQLEGWHTADIAAHYRVSTAMVNRILRQIPPEARAMIVADRSRLGSRWIVEITLGRSLDGPGPERRSPRKILRGLFSVRDLDAPRFSRDARAMVREMARRIDGGEPIVQVARSFGTSPAVVKRAVWESRTRGDRRQAP